MVQTRLTQTVAMLVLSESVVIMEQHVMDHLYRRILNHSGRKSVQQCVKDAVNVILDIIVIRTGKNLYYEGFQNSVPLINSKVMHCF